MRFKKNFSERFNTTLLFLIQYQLVAACEEKAGFASELFMPASELTGFVRELFSFAGNRCSLFGNFLCSHACKRY